MEMIIAATVTAIATVIVALIAKMNINRTNAVKQAVGEPNGRGSVVQMNETQLDALDRLEEKFEDVDLHRVNAERKMQELVSAVAAMNFNMQGMTRFQNLVTGVRMDFEARFEEIARQLADLDKRLEAVEKVAHKQGRTFEIPHLASRHIERDVND